MLATISASEYCNKNVCESIIIDDISVVRWRSLVFDPELFEVVLSVVIVPFFLNLPIFDY